MAIVAAPASHPPRCLFSKKEEAHPSALHAPASTCTSLDHRSNDPITWPGTFRMWDGAVLLRLAGGRGATPPKPCG